MGSTGTTKFNVEVAQDKSGDFTTVSDAVKAAPINSNTRFIIRIKPGIYKERVVIDFNMTFITLIGDDVLKTIITFDLSNGSGIPTIDTGTLSKNNIIYLFVLEFVKLLNQFLNLHIYVCTYVE